MKARQLVKLVKDNGWTLARVNGSHHVFTHPPFAKVLVIPIHAMNDDIPNGLLHKLLKTIEEANVE
jgi:predicted RNA binding protein YcfA (HicA-like mRNA interferase family)